MKKILITGPYGFIGSHLLNKLKKSKNEIYTFSRSKKNSSNHFSGNFLNTNLFDNILKKIRPEIIIHLAWETTPSKFYEDKINVKWSKATIDFIKKFYLQGGEKFIFSSTCDEYGVSSMSKNIEEVKECHPKTLYGKSKNSVSNYLEKNFKNQSVVLRNFFVCGPGEDKSKLLSYIINNVKNKKKINLKRPEDLIDFIDVRDIASIIYKLADGDYTGIFNLGTSIQNTPFNLTKKILKIKDLKVSKYLVDSSEQDDKLRIVANNLKLKEILKYKIKFNIDKTINDLIKFYDV